MDINSVKITYFKNSNNEYEVRVISPVPLKDSKGNPIYHILIKDKSVFNIYKNFCTENKLISIYKDYLHTYSDLAPTIKTNNIMIQEEKNLHLALLAASENDIIIDLYNTSSNNVKNYHPTELDKEFILQNPKPAKSISEYIKNKKTFFLAKTNKLKEQELNDKLFAFIYGLVKREISNRKAMKLKNTNRIGRLAKSKLQQKQR